MEKSGNMAPEFVQKSTLPESPANGFPAHDDLTGETLQSVIMRRRLIRQAVDLTSRPGWARLQDRNPNAP